MSNPNGTGTIWNLPNYAGELFTADATTTPFLSMIGGLSGGKRTTNFEFPCSVEFAQPTAAQPAITETASETAPEATALERTQTKNVCQIFQETIALTYAKMSNAGRLSGINTAGASNSVSNEKDWQIQQRLIKIARDVEYSFLNGKYQIATSAGVANKTRGMIELCSGGNTIAAADAGLTKAMLDNLFLEMAKNGALFRNMVLYCNAYQKQQITNAFNGQTGFALPATRNVGGMNIQEFETDFCKVGVVYDRFMPVDTILVADLSVCSPVFQEVPGKGILFEEALAKTGAADKVQIYGQIGLDHGPAFAHGTITGLKNA